ncbi:hypothetical protein SAMN05216276_105218 [Streptosporangium subroseum]|uniref:Uncharacterized protein n=1 Tax=Streptosporangium subroseum TaxID=106412 RepID=A0A239N6M8_9ACTN|nr:hypothetical protein SAMN05216276_105218 [Streptosporangium subroseum]
MITWTEWVCRVAPGAIVTIWIGLGPPDSQGCARCVHGLLGWFGIHRVHEVVSGAFMARSAYGKGVGERGKGI